MNMEHSGRYHSKSLKILVMQSSGKLSILKAKQSGNLQISNLFVHLTSYMVNLDGLQLLQSDIHNAISVVTLSLKCC